MDAIGNLLRRALPAAPDGADELTRICVAWRSVAGARISEAWPARVTRDRTLVINATSSVWAQELTMLGDELLAGLVSHGCEVARLRIVVGPVPRV